jgi:predicted RNase H-like HicB family nuclease
MRTKIYTFRIIIEPNKPSGYHGFVPLLKGVHTQGETIEEVKEILKK